MHWSKLDEVLKAAGDLSGKVIVTCSLPMNADNTDLVIAHHPNARVVAAFNTVPSEVLFDVFDTRDSA